MDASKSTVEAKREGRVLNIMIRDLRTVRQEVRCVTERIARLNVAWRWYASYTRSSI